LLEFPTFLPCFIIFLILSNLLFSYNNPPFTNSITTLIFFFQHLVFPLIPHSLYPPIEADMVAASPISIRSEKISPIDLPMVDLTGERSMVKKLIVKACEEYGFFNVINHGVPRDTIAKMEEAAFDFFAKPMAQKKQVALYGCKNIGFNGDMGEVEYLLLSATPPSVAHLKNISNVPSNFRYVHSFSTYVPVIVQYFYIF